MSLLLAVSLYAEPGHVYATFLGRPIRKGAGRLQSSARDSRFPFEQRGHRMAADF